MDNILSSREIFYKELSQQVNYIRNSLNLNKRDTLILGGIEALIINCNRRKALVHKTLNQSKDKNNLEFFVDTDTFKRLNKDRSDEDFITINLTDEIKVSLINLVPPSFKGVDFRFATAEFLLSDEELSIRGDNGNFPYGLDDEIIQEMKFSLGIISRLITPLNVDNQNTIPKDSLDGDFPSIILKTILAVIDEKVRNIYLVFLRMVMDKTVNLTTIDGYIQKHSLKESLIERILLIRSQNLNSKMEELLTEYSIDLNAI